VHDLTNIFLLVTPRSEHVRQVGQIGDGVEICRGLLAPKSAVQVRANAAVEGIAGDLADVIDVVNDSFQLQPGRLRRGLAPNPARNHHPRVEDRADDGATFHQDADLVIGKLAVMLDESATVGMTSPKGAGEAVERFLEAVVAQVGDIENHTQAIHFLEEFTAAGAETAGGVGALRVSAWPIMGGPDGTQALGIGAFEVAEGDEGVRTFQTEDVADRP